MRRQFTAAGLDSPTRTTHYRPRFVAFSDKLPTPQLIPVACLVPTLIGALCPCVENGAYQASLSLSTLPHDLTSFAQPPGFRPLPSVDQRQ